MPAATALSRPSSSRVSSTEQRQRERKEEMVEPKVVVHAFVLVDASGSMQEKVDGHTTKMEAVAAALIEQFIRDVLKGDDRITVAVFSNHSKQLLTVPVQKLDEGKLKKSFNVLLYEEMGGGTELYASVAEATERIRVSAQTISILLWCSHVASHFVEHMLH